MSQPGAKQSTEKHSSKQPTKDGDAEERAPKSRKRAEAEGPATNEEDKKSIEAKSDDGDDADDDGDDVAEDEDKSDAGDAPKKPGKASRKRRRGKNKDVQRVRYNLVKPALLADIVEGCGHKGPFNRSEVFPTAAESILKEFLDRIAGNCQLAVGRNPQAEATTIKVADIVNFVRLVCNKEHYPPALTSKLYTTASSFLEKTNEVTKWRSKWSKLMAELKKKGVHAWNRPKKQALDEKRKKADPEAEDDEKKEQKRKKAAVSWPVEWESDSSVGEFTISEWETKTSMPKFDTKFLNVGRIVSHFVAKSQLHNCRLTSGAKTLLFCVVENFYRMICKPVVLAAIQLHKGRLLAEKKIQRKRTSEGKEVEEKQLRLVLSEDAVFMAMQKHIPGKEDDSMVVVDPHMFSMYNEHCFNLEKVASLTQAMYRSIAANLYRQAHVQA